MDRLKSLSMSKSSVTGGTKPSLSYSNVGMAAGVSPVVPSSNLNSSGTNVPRPLGDLSSSQTRINSPTTGNVFEAPDFFPDMFVLDGLSENQEIGPSNFFDLLRVPGWDEIDAGFGI